MKTATKTRSPRAADVSPGSADYGYPDAWRHKSIGEQVRCFVSGELSPEYRRFNASFIDAIVANGVGAGADGMDGWIVHPKPSRLAGSGTGERDWPALSRALAAVARLFARRQHHFVDTTAGQFGPDHYRLTDKTRETFAALEQRFPGDFVAYRAQSGARRRTSALDARASLGANEFGLDAIAVGCFLLTHPERLVGLEALGIDCIGGEYRKDPANEFNHSPAWVCFDGSYGVGLGLSLVDQADPALGCATGLLPR